MTARYHSEVILKKTQKLKKLCLRLAQKNILFHYDGPSHTVSCTVELIHSFKWQLLSHPPYSPKIALCDLFPELKTGALETDMRQEGFEFSCKSVPQQ